MNLCIPYLTIEPIISKLSAQYWYSTVRKAGTTENFNILRDTISNIRITLSADIGSITVRMRDILALKTGDVVRLDNVRPRDMLEFRVGGKTKFLCRPGVAGNKVAVQITKKLEEIVESEFEELSAGEVG